MAKVVDPTRHEYQEIGSVADRDQGPSKQQDLDPGDLIEQQDSNPGDFMIEPAFEESH